MSITEAVSVRRFAAAIGGAVRKQFRPLIVLLVLASANACDDLQTAMHIPDAGGPTPQVASANATPLGSAQGAQSSIRAPQGIRVGAPQAVPGTGVFVQPAASGPPGAVPAVGADITFNFVNADVRDVLREILGEQLHLEFSVDPKLQATITAQTGAPIPRSAVLPTLENILRTSGVALLQVGGTYRAVPLEDASRASSATVTHPNTTPPGYSIRVLPLKFVRAADLKPILDPFAPPGGVLETDNNRNLLIVSGTSGDLDGFAELVRQFDVDWLAGKSVGIYPLHVGKTKDITTELQAILDQGADGTGPLAGLVRVVPVERLNAILVITSKASYLSQVKAWVERLDYGDADATPRFFKYQVQKTRATDLARVLRQLFAAGDVRIVPPAKSPGPSFTRLATSASAQGNVGAVPSGIPGVAAGGSLPLAAPVQRPAEEEHEPPSSGVPVAGVASPLELPPARIVADEKNNTLVIFARPRDYRIIEDMLRQLDIAPQQVMIEATVAELTLNDELQYGVQYFLKDGAHRAEFSTSKSGVLGPQDLAGLFPGFNYIVASSAQHAILSALKTVTKVTILSSPQLLVRDHQTAGLQVGAQVPIVIQSAQSTIGANSPIVNSVEYRNTGVILEVTPRINPDGMITLDVDQEVSDVAPTTSSTIDSPTINDRHLVSSILVQDGQTIALGGLIREDGNDSKGGVPYLSDIPVFGPLFRATSRSKGRTELLVLLSPKVVRNEKDVRTMTEDLRNRIQGLRPLGDRRN